MSDTFWIYLFIKLNDIKTMIRGCGLTLLTFITLAIYTFILYPVGHKEELIDEKVNEKNKAKGPKSDSNNAYTAEDFSMIDVYDRAIGRTIMKSLTIFLIAMFIEVGMNGVAYLMPSTGQAAAIYLGVKAKQSDTIDTLSKLPPKFAKILEMQATKYVCDTAKETFGDNIPIDISDMCGIPQHDTVEHTE